MRPPAKKPAILQEKKKLAQAFLLRGTIKGWRRSYYSQHPQGYYWTGMWEKDGMEVRIFVQMYARRRTEVDYIRIEWYPNHEALKPAQIKSFLTELIN